MKCGKSNDRRAYAQIVFSLEWQLKSSRKIPKTINLILYEKHMIFYPWSEQTEYCDNFVQTEEWDFREFFTKTSILVYYDVSSVALLYW